MHGARPRRAVPSGRLAATVERPGELRLEGGALIAYDPARVKALPAAKVLAGLRPETVRLGRADGRAGAPAFRLELVEELGMGRLVHGRIGESAFTVAQGPADAAPQGDAFSIEVAPASVHVFDAASGARL